MRFEPLAITGASLVVPERREDARGFFARTWCAEEFAAAGLDAAAAQASVSFNPAVGTLRGLHFQWPPSREAKTVRCTRGAVYDVLLDLRPESASYLAHVGVVLDAENRLAVHIPPGVAHGFLTLQPDTEVLYLMSSPYVPGLDGVVRWNDAAFGIEWPATVCTLSDRDANCPDFTREGFEAALAARR